MLQPLLYPGRSLWGRLLLAGLLPILAPVAAAAQEDEDRLYVAGQAAAGEQVYETYCVSCHGPDLRGGNGPPLVGNAFLESWGFGPATRSLSDLFFVESTLMPPGRVREVTPEQHLNVMAYILQRNGYQPGDVPLTADEERLRAVALRPQPFTNLAARAPRPDFFAGDGGLEPEATGPTQAELEGAAANGRDWLFATHDYTGRRYAPLRLINRANVGRLRPVCAYQVGEITNFQTGPIVYRGVMYLTTSRLTVAIDAKTCRPLWRYAWDVPEGTGWQNRGVAIKDGRVVRATVDGFLIALDAKTGRLLWDRRVSDAVRGEWFTMAPMIYDDLIILGPAVSELGIRGWVGAFSLRDGSPVWRFNIVPAPGEPGAESWAQPAGFPVGGGGVWTPFTLDVARGLLFVGAGNPAPDLPASLRGGANLYTNTLLALDVRTGKLVWHDQMVPEDDHDWDLTHASPIFRTPVGGVPRDLIATVGKDGMLRVLDRQSRERLYETPVTTRENVEAPVTPAGTRACPGILGGVEWSGPAYNPGANLLYTPAVDWCVTFYSTDSVRFIPGAMYLGGTYMFDSTSHGWLTAVDASTGKVRWRYRSPRPMVAAVTTTAGGLVFTGELTGDFLAFDAATGRELYRFNTGGPIGGGVITYEVDGRQYVAVASGRPSPFWINEHPGAPTVFVFSLP